MARPAEGGIALVELAVALPLVLLLILGGFAAGYGLFVKLALVWHVHQESERLALDARGAGAGPGAREPAAPPAGLRADRFRSLSTSVVLPDGPLAVSAACYLLPAGPGWAAAAGDAGEGGGASPGPDGWPEQIRRVAGQAGGVSGPGLLRLERWMEGVAKAACAGSTGWVVTAVAVARGEQTREYR